MKDCPCWPPIPSEDPRRKGICAACGFALNPDWGSENVSKFLDRLAEAIPGAVNPKTGKPSPTWTAFREQCESRERAGRKHFGYAFHTRSNLREAFEEAADGANYSAFDTIVHRRKEGADEDIDLALTAAQKFYEAYEALCGLHAKRHHAP
jgi:hypothetical protein